MLSHIGYEVVTCRDGAQAIAAFAKSKSTGEPYDVVMMDLVIPNGVGGQDAVHTIKKIDPTARVIASSGHPRSPGDEGPTPVSASTPCSRSPTSWKNCSRSSRRLSAAASK